MSNIETANALLSAINADRFAEIEALHNPDCVFFSFRGPTAYGSGAVGDWHRKFLQDYADCQYTNVEYVEDGDTVAARATLLAKGYDFREFSQRVVDVMEFADGGVAARRLYAMPADTEFSKPAEAALKNATGYRGGSASATRKAVDGFFGALLSGDIDAAKEHLDPKAVLVDGVYGTAVGPDNIIALVAAQPTPAFGRWRVTASLAGPRDALVEIAMAPRPRAANWVRVVDEKIVLFEAHWMLREVGVRPEAGNRERYAKQVIMPI